MIDATETSHLKSTKEFDQRGHLLLVRTKLPAELGRHGLGECQTDEELRKHNEKDGGRKKRILKHAERTSRSKEDRVERDVKKRRNSKAESMSAGSISDSFSLGRGSTD